MSNPIQIEINGDAQEYLKTISNPAKVSLALAGVMDRENEVTIFHIKNDRLSFPADGPTTMNGLRCISRRLRDSISRSKARFGDDGIVSSIGSNVVYAGILEDGGTTKPHVIEARNGKALFFNGVFRRRVKHPGSRIEGRHYAENGIRDRLPDYTRAFGETIARLS